MGPNAAPKQNGATLMGIRGDRPLGHPRTGLVKSLSELTPTTPYWLRSNTERPLRRFKFDVGGGALVNK